MTATGIAYQAPPMAMALGLTPSNWTVRRLKDVALINRATLAEATDEDRSFRYVDIGSVDSLGRLEVGEETTFGTAPSRARRLVREGDSIVSTVRTYLKSIAYVGDNAEDLVVSTGFATLTPTPRLLPRYLYWWLRSEPFVEEVVARSVGVSYPAVTASDIGDVGIAFPAIDDQRRIVRFLDVRTGLIDELISEQERSVGLLLDRRSTDITEAVTRGLDPNSPRRDSGVPWIGRIPAHWRIQRLKTIGRATIGLTFDPSDIVLDPSEGTLVLRAGNVQSEQIITDDNVYVASFIPDKLRLRAGDILICSRSGSADLIGKSAVVPEELAGASWGTFMTVFRSPMNRWVSWVLRSSLFAQQVGLFATSTINQLTSMTLHNFQIPVPPPAEQRLITDHLEAATGELDDLVGELRLSVSLAHERRTSLIASALVRGPEFAETVA